MMDLPEIEDGSNTAVQFMASDSKSVNENDMSESIAPFDTSIETIVLADLSALTSGIAPKRRRSMRSTGGASLDILLGLGCGGNDASDSEGDNVDCMKSKSSSSVVSVLQGAMPVMYSGDPVPRMDDLSTRVSCLLSSVNINQPSNRPKRNFLVGKKRVMRLQVGVCDIFSDDDEEETVPSAPMELSVAEMEFVPSASEESSEEEMIVDTTDSDFFAGIKDVGVTGTNYPQRSSTVRRSVVSFVEVAAGPSKESPFLDELDSDLMVPGSSRLSSGCRRSCRLSNVSSSSSTKKARRQATPYAPRFARPNSGTPGGGKTSMDVMRQDCGYGSYFSSMNSPEKVGVIL